MKHKCILFLRYTLQIGTLICFLYLLTNIKYPLEEQAGLLKKLSWLDPWGLLNYIRWQISLPTWIWLPVVTLMITLLFGRVFCGWFCPFGTVLMLVDKMSRLLLRSKRFRKIAAFRLKLIKRLQPYRYVWLLFLVITFLFGLSLAYSLTPFALLSSGILKVLTGTVPWLLLVVILLTVLFSRIWCSVLCPTGLLLSVFSRYRLFGYQISDACVHCGRCSKSCSVGADPESSGISKDNCLVCGDCRNSCKPGAVKFRFRFVKRDKPEVDSETAATDTKKIHSRRQFLKITGTGLVAAAVLLGEKTVFAAKKVLRPPGSLLEDKFSSVCNRCGRCIKVCPNHALKPMNLADGIETYGTPHIVAREASCCLCFSCHEVCPTGAIAKVELEQVHMGKASLHKQECLAWAQNKLCLTCVEQCPAGAITYDEKQRPIVKTENCIGCGSCERCCAVVGKAAIRVEPN